MELRLQYILHFLGSNMSNDTKLYVFLLTPTLNGKHILKSTYNIATACLNWDVFKITL